MYVPSRLAVEQAKAALKSHDAALRARVAELEELTKSQSDLLRQVSCLFLMGGYKGVSDKLQAQLRKYEPDFTKGDHL